jgi:ribosome-associated toxin RatA of RatAB toxin-antitoxin module
MSNATPSTAPSAPRLPARRWRKRWTLIPSALLLAVAIALGIFYARGTWADTEARNPATVAEGPISQLYLGEDQHKQVRCAIVLPYTVDEVWDVLTDYGKYSNILPYLSSIEAEKKSDDETRMKGLAKSAVQGNWPFEITIHQQKNPDGGRIWWEETPGNGEVEVNKGSWTLSKHGDKEALLVLALEAEVKSTPTFVLRNFFRYRLKKVMQAVEQAVQRRKQGS